MSAIDEFNNGLERNRAGRGGVAVAACSAHPMVLQALFRTARRYDTFALIESTSNQVDQYGGYTGLRPADFVRLVQDLADREGFPRERVLLGGDHLGPNAWSGRPAEAAMAEADRLVAAYVRAGYRKIHLDASFVCADDAAPLTNEVVAARCARMAAVCEASWSGTAPVYVVGTEVPTPGGTRDDEQLRVTSAADVEQTLAVFKQTFRQAGLQAAWDRVVGLVVQPGVEFADGAVHDFRPVPELAAAILEYPGLVYEAHSTDYQTAANLRRLAESHFYVLKVGPWLTHALREALFMLDLIDQELAPAAPAALREALLAAMQSDPGYWKKYYHGSPQEIALKLAFSYSDRARYYLGRAEVQAAVARLVTAYDGGVPLELLSQYFPVQYGKVRCGALRNRAADLVIDHVGGVLARYMQAGRPADPGT